MIQNRLTKVQKQMQEQAVDYLVLVPGPNLTYLTGTEFMLLERPFLVFIAAAEDSDIIIVIPELELPAWEREVSANTQVYAWSDETGPEEAVRRAASVLNGVRSVAAEYLRMRLLEHSLLRLALPDVVITQAELIMTPVRVRKDAAEIEAHRRAVTISHTALEQVLAGLQPGMTEREICSQLTAALLQNGGETVPIEPLVQSGPNSAMPHGRTTGRTVGLGEILLFDFVTTINGYYSDLTRTFVFGRAADARLQAVYEAVKAANTAARALAGPGVACQDVDRAARRVIVEAGFGEYFVHRTGHGLGLDVHEEPNIVEGNEEQLQQGMVFTIEPGIYIPGWGGVRIEDNVVITADGCESLSTLGRELRILDV